MPQSKRRITWGLGLGLLAWQCFFPLSATADGSRTALIGFAARLSDSLAQSARQGTELAVEEANQQRYPESEPIQFVLLAQDDQGNPHLAVNVARYFVKSRVAGVIGHWSSESILAAGRTYEEAGIAQINFTSSSSQVTRQGYQTSFRVIGGTADLAVSLADAAIDVLQGQRVAIIGNDSAYSVALSNSLAAEVVARSKKVLERTTISAKTSDFNAVLKAAVDEHADVIVFSAYVVQLGAFVKAVKRLGIKAKILLTSGASNQNVTAEDNGNFYVLEPDIQQEHCRSWKTFEQKFQRRFGRPSTTYARYAYNATNTLIQAVRQADVVNGLPVTLALHKIHYMGLSGAIMFDQAGNSINPAYTLYHFEAPGWRAVQFFSPDQRKIGQCIKG